MKARKQLPDAVRRVRSWPVLGLLLLAGCNQVHTSASAHAAAPGLSEGQGLRGTHNAADPNAPFSSLAGAPHLSAREPLLDIDEVPPCDPAQLNLYESRAQANGAHHTLRLTLGNVGAACRLGGFPAVSLLAPDGHVLRAIRLERVSVESMTASLVAAAPQAAPGSVAKDAAPAAASPQVLLPAKGGAAFQLGWTSGANCLEASRIAITAPSLHQAGGSPAVIISRPLSVCEDLVLITAIGPAGLD